MQHRKRRKIQKKSFKLWITLLLVIAIILLAIFYLTSTSIKQIAAKNRTPVMEKARKIAVKRKIKKDSLKTKILVKKNQRLPQVEILNGCGVSKVTSYFLPFFKKQNLDVISTANYVNFRQKKSFLKYHTLAMRRRVDELARRLNIKKVIPDIQLKPTQEITLVIGADYGTLNFKGL